MISDYTYDVLVVIVLPGKRKTMKTIRNILMVGGLTVLFVAGQEAIQQLDEKPKVIKSVDYNGATIALRTTKGKSNVLVLRKQGAAEKNLSNNKLFIQDFCVSKGGVIYYAEAGRDQGFEPEIGTRSGDFSLYRVDLKAKDQEPIKIVVKELKELSRPKKIELSHDEKFLCFATDFGDIYVLDLKQNKLVDILPDLYPAEDVHGFFLTKDRKQFFVKVRTHTKQCGTFNWDDYTIDLASKKLTPVEK